MNMLSSPLPPLVTVVIPAYNRMPLIMEAVRSVIDQTYTRWELIIVDDGSVDDTVEAIKGLSDPRIRIFELPHSGHIGLLRNIGVEYSQGEWIAFLDSDDIWMPNKLELQLQTLKEEGKKWAYGEYEYIDENKKTIYKSYEKFAPFNGNIIKEVIIGKTGITICSVIVEKKFFNDIGGFSSTLEIKGDYELILRLALKAEVAITKGIVTRIRNHPNRIYKAASYPYERTILVYKAFIDLKPGKEYKRSARSRIAFFLSEACIHRFEKGYNGIAVRQLGQALFMMDNPRHWLSALKRGIYAAYKKNFQYSSEKRKEENATAYNT